MTTKPPRREEVLDMRDRGLTFREIGRVFGVSHTRADQMVREARHLLAMERRHQAVRALAENGDRVALLATPITEVLFRSPYLGTHVRVQNCLKNDAIRTLGELVQRTAFELIRAPNFGKRSLEAIVRTLAELGLELASSDPPPRPSVWVPPQIAFFPIRDLEWSTRVTNCLADIPAVVSVRDLANCTHADLLAITNFGMTSLREVAEMLHYLGVVGWGLIKPEALQGAPPMPLRPGDPDLPGYVPLGEADGWQPEDATRQLVTQLLRALELTMADAQRHGDHYASQATCVQAVAAAKRWLVLTAPEPAPPPPAPRTPSAA